MYFKYYAGGVEISAEEKNRILNGHTDKLIRCPDGQPGIPIVKLTDHLNIINNIIDENDPLLKAVLEVLELPLTN